MSQDELKTVFANLEKLEERVLKLHQDVLDMRDDFLRVSGRIVALEKKIGS